MALPCGAMGLSAVCDVVFPDHTHLLFLAYYWSCNLRTIDRSHFDVINQIRECRRPKSVLIIQFIKMYTGCKDFFNNRNQ